MPKRCNACGGEYEELTAEGLLYFHSCPPITRVRVIRNGQDQRVDLADLQPSDVVSIVREGEQLEIAVSELRAGDQRIGDVTRERPDRRDENSATIGGEEEADDRMPRRRRRIKARGRGVTDVARRDPDAP